MPKLKPNKLTIEKQQRGITKLTQRVIELDNQLKEAIKLKDLVLF